MYLPVGRLIADSAFRSASNLGPLCRPGFFLAGNSRNGFICAD
jgi:hypothetical protein